MYAALRVASHVDYRLVCYQQTDAVQLARTTFIVLFNDIEPIHVFIPIGRLMIL